MFCSHFIHGYAYTEVNARDTVSSVGIIPRKLPFTTSNTLVRTFRHALALDERRAKFKANTWNRPTEIDTKMATPPPTRAGTFSHLQRTWGKGKKPAAAKSSLPALFRNPSNGESTVRTSESSTADEMHKEDPTHQAIPDMFEQFFDGTSDHGDMDVQHLLEQVFSQSGKHDKDTDIEEVWFAGTHCGTLFVGCDFHCGLTYCNRCGWRVRQE